MKNKIGQIFSMQNGQEVKHSEPKSRVANALLDFCANSSFHAIAYIGDGKRRFIERTWWFVALTSSVSLCIVSIYSIWCNWCENPVIVSMSNKPMSVGEIPFPAVTICPIAKFSATKFNFTQAYRSMFELDDNHTQPTDEELNLMKIASQICDNTFAGDILDNFTDNFSDHRMLEIIRDMAPSFADTMFQCKFLDESDCEKLFYPIITEEGLCYSFNALSLSEIATDKLSSDFFEIGPNSTTSSNWNMYTGYTGNGTESYPMRVYGTSVQSGISVILEVLKQDFDSLCSGGINGFKVTFHPPQEGPGILEKFFHISPGKSAIFTIDPNVIETSPAVLKYSPDVRQCYYKDERTLQFYKHYTQRNCEVECLANYTLTVCGCLVFSMTARSNETKICGPGKMQCTSDASQGVFTSGAFAQCNCLPSCTLISYDAVATQGDYDLSSAWSKSKYQTKLSFDNSTFSRLVIFFKDEMFIPMKRSEFYSLSSFLASSGGLFGLFLGASLLSFIELFYYFSVRIFCTPN